MLCVDGCFSLENHVGDPWIILGSRYERTFEPATTILYIGIFLYYLMPSQSQGYLAVKHFQAKFHVHRPAHSHPRLALPLIPQCPICGPGRVCGVQFEMQYHVCRIVHSGPRLSQSTAQPTTVAANCDFRIGTGTNGIGICAMFQHKRRGGNVAFLDRPDQCKIKIEAFEVAVRAAACSTRWLAILI